MRIKKFTCINCGAPKVNEYKSPYIMCDYCGSFTDIDFTLGMNFWNSSSGRNIGYAFNKVQFAMQLQSAQQRGAHDEYSGLQRRYWDYYYKTYPEYLPPSIDNENKYKLYLDVCAKSSTAYAFDTTIQQNLVEMNRLQQSLSYYMVGGQNKVNADAFFRMAEFYINLTKDGFKDFYNNPDYAIMNDLLPQQVHLKMKLSMFVQIWLPYLTDEDADRFLKLTGFSMQYVEIQKPPGHDDKCEHCGAGIYVPEGSFRVYCEACRKTTRVKQTFICSSCGAENTVPENPSKPVDCEFCGTENRLIQAMFG